MIGLRKPLNAVFNNETAQERKEKKIPNDQQTPHSDESKEEEPSKEQPTQEDLPWLEETVTVSGDGVAVVQNLDDLLIVANKERNLPKDYEPADLVTPNVPFPFKEDLPKKKMRKEAAFSLEVLFKAAEEEGLELNQTSSRPG